MELGYIVFLNKTGTANTVMHRSIKHNSLRVEMIA